MSDQSEKQSISISEEPSKLQGYAFNSQKEREKYEAPRKKEETKKVYRLLVLFIFLHVILAVALWILHEPTTNNIYFDFVIGCMCDDESVRSLLLGIICLVYCISLICILAVFNDEVLYEKRWDIMGAQISLWKIVATVFTIISVTVIGYQWFVYTHINHNARGTVLIDIGLLVSSTFGAVLAYRKEKGDYLKWILYINLGIWGFFARFFIIGLVSASVIMLFLPVGM